MIVGPQELDAGELQAYRATTAFLSGRLEEAATISWALNLTSKNRAQLAALSSLLRSGAVTRLREPWKQAWRLIEESWGSQAEVEDDFSEYEIRERLAAGERSSSVIGAIVNRVAARVKVAAFSNFDSRFRKLPRRPRRATDLFNVTMTSGQVLDPDRLTLAEITQRNFLVELATALDLSVLSALAQGRRMGWDPEAALWRYGSLSRVYFISAKERRTEEHEPDEFNHGIAPSVKLLHAVVARVSEIEVDAARAFMDRWRKLESPVHDRLWASLALQVTCTAEIYQFVFSRPPRQFWDTYAYPEVAELRARSFGHFENEAQEGLCAKIKRGPPLRLWRNDIEKDVRRERKQYMIVRELRRIEVAGGKLPPSIASWYERSLKVYPELRRMRVDDGFPGTAKAHWVAPHPDKKFDQLSGLERLRSLERSLRAERVSWSDDPAERASDWIKSDENVLLILSDLETIESPGDYPRVWERFGWQHNLPAKGTKKRRKKDEAARVAKLIRSLPDHTILEAIEGLSWWFSTWGTYLRGRTDLLQTWRKLWPAAVTATNAREANKDVELTVESSEPVEALDIDTLNNPVGRMTGVFLGACPNLATDPHPFRRGSILTIIRNQIGRLEGQSRLIAIHRLLEGLPYFLKADAAWSEAHLLAPLRADSRDALVLWHAIARRTHFGKVLKILGRQMLQRVTDVRLSRSTRESLIFSLVVECLHALRKARRPAVPLAEVQQVLRSVEDEVRAHAANVLQQFVRELSGQDGETSERLFDVSIDPFLASVWPQERSLATPGVSSGLADLPASVGKRFAEAVEAVERFLVPFDAWSSMEYGLYGELDGEPKLQTIDTPPKAIALLKLLDATIGTAEGSVIPHDLSELLTHIRNISPRVATTPPFRRLAAAARI